jgi:hypothetical protein
VVSQDTDSLESIQAAEDLLRPRPQSNQVARAQIPAHLSIDRGEDRFQGRQVGVYVRKKGQACHLKAAARQEERLKRESLPFR